jgi:hypothetical protein
MDGNPERNNPGRVFGVYSGNGLALEGHDAMLPGVGKLWTESGISLAMVTSFMRSRRYGFTCDDKAKSVSMCLRNTRCDPPLGTARPPRDSEKAHANTMPPRFRGPMIAGRN